MRIPDPAASLQVELPPLVGAAMRAARRTESRMVRTAILRTILLIGAAVLGAVTITQTIDDRTVDWAGWAVLLIFVALLGLRLFEWTEDRRDSPRLRSAAVADLTESHAWRYATRANPYSEATYATDEAAAADRFLDALQKYHDTLGEAATDLPGGRQITPSMDQLRSSDLNTRIDIYLEQRVNPLADRASREGRQRGRIHGQFFTAVLVIELAGIPLGALKAQNVTGIDWIGVLSAAAASLALLADSMRLSQRAKVARSKTRVLNYVADQTRAVSNEIDWAALVTRVEDHITLDAEASLASDAAVSAGPPPVARYAMTPEDYFKAVDHLRQRIWGGLGGPVEAPDVIIALNPGGAIVGGILYFSTSRAPAFVPLTLRGGMEAAGIQTYLRSIKFRAQKTGRLVVLIIDASLKSGKGMAQAVEYVTAVLEEKGWRARGTVATVPDSPGEYTLRTVVITQPTLRPGDEPRVMEADYFHDTTTQRFPYGTV